MDAGWNLRGLLQVARALDFHPVININLCFYLKKNLLCLLVKKLNVEKAMSEKRVKRFHKTIMVANVAVFAFILLLLIFGPVKLLHQKGRFVRKSKRSMASSQWQKERTIDASYKRESKNL